jgi:hypothetical protein
MPTALGTVASHRTAAGGAFSPANLTGLAGWWDADDASTFTYTTAPIISQWRDKSPNLLHMAPEYSPNADLVRSGDINGRTAMLNKATNYMGTLSRAAVNVMTLLDAGGTDCMWFIACRPVADPGTAWGLQPSTYRVSWYWFLTSVSYLDVVNYTGGRLSANMAMTSGTPYVLAMYRNGANMAVVRDGTTVASKSNASGAAASETGTMRLMDGPNAGHYGEIIMVARYNAADFAATRNYLAAKWGITLS